MAKRKLFGTDGIRGKANQYPMTGEMAMALGRSVTSYFQQKKTGQKPLIIIGKDTRLSCYMLEQAFSSGVCSQGGRAILTGPLPTPGVAFVTKSMRADAGVMISASHNSYDDNGIKIFDRNGDKLSDSVEAELERYIFNPDLLEVPTNHDLGNTKRLDEVIGRYVVHVKSAFNSSYTLEGLRVVVDPANGAAYKVGPIVFSELGAEVITINNEPNGFNINDGCGSLYPQRCAEAVSKFRADFGICLDGDADRLQVIDGKGNLVSGDRILGLCGRFLKDQEALGKNNEVVGTVLSNIGLEQYFGHQKIKFSRTQVGDRYILEHMKKTGALFGGEPSGHFVFKQYSSTGDGILAALKILEAVNYYQKDLSDLASEVPLFPQTSRNIKVKSKPKFENIPNIKKTLEEVEKELGEQGRVIMRYSGTEPKARIMVEGRDEGQVGELCSLLAGIVQDEIGS